MKDLGRRVLVFVLCYSLFAYATGNSFKVRYNGGSIASKVGPKDWDNHLTVTADAITLELKDKNRVDIPPKSVTSLSYGQEAHRRVGTMIALAVLVAPVALFGLFHKTRLHYIGIQYKTSDGKDAGILLQGDKDDYRAILVALQGVTGAPVSVAEKEREFLPVGITTTVTRDSEVSSEGQPAATPQVQMVAHTNTTKVAVVSNPAAADIEVDGGFVGNTPSTIDLTNGDHTITVSKTGYKPWERKLKASGGSVNLNVELEPK